MKETNTWKARVRMSPSVYLGKKLLTQDKLERADKLVGGLAGEFVRWEASIGLYEAMIERLIGDSLIAAAFLSYAGTFDTIYRYQDTHYISLKCPSHTTRRIHDTHIKFTSIRLGTYP